MGVLETVQAVSDTTVTNTSVPAIDVSGSPLGACASVYDAQPGASIPDRGPPTAASIWLLLVLATIFLALRVYSKLYRGRRLWWDDWILLLSWACFIVDAAASQAVINLGFGKYPCDIDIRNFSALGLLSNVGSTFAILGIVWSKTAFAITLLRLVEGKTKAIVWFAIISMNLAMGLESIFTWVQCMPVAKTWDQSIPGTCWSAEVSSGYAVFSSVYSGAMDVLLALLPWRLVWHTQMKKREKVGVAVAMSMGCFAGVTAFIKSSKVPTLVSKNFTYDGCALLVWAAAEISTTIMACCIPMLRALFREVRQKSSYARREDSHGSDMYSQGLGSNRRTGSQNQPTAASAPDEITLPNLTRGGAYWRPENNKTGSGRGDSDGDITILLVEGAIGGGNPVSPPSLGYVSHKPEFLESKDRQPGVHRTTNSSSWWEGEPSESNRTWYTVS